MQPDGRKVIALWREAGEWWSGEPYREVRRYLDEQGIRREEEKLLPCIANSVTLQHDVSYSPIDSIEDQSEEWDLKKKKRRDEKVAKACGAFVEGQGTRDKGQGTGRKEEWKSGINSSPLTSIPAFLHSSIPSPEHPCPLSLVPCPSTHTPYIPLHVLSGYAFGRGCMLAEEIPILAAHAGLPAAAIADPFSLVGAVEFSKQAKKSGIKPLVGASFELAEGGEIVLIAKSKKGYENLSKLITACHLEEPRLFPLCTWERLERLRDDLICLTGGDSGPINRLLSRKQYKAAKAVAERLVGLYGAQSVFFEIERSFLPWEISVNDLLVQLAAKLQAKCVAGGAVTHARREHFPVQDILLCAESLCVVDEVIGRKPRRHPDQPQLDPRPERALNAERFLRTAAEMGQLFRDRPDLLANTLAVADLCEDDVLPSRTQLPKLYSDEDYVLREYTLAGALLRHKKISARLKSRINHELARISKLNFSGHFLVMWDACRWASEQNIQFSGRGSVVDSAVAYCLGLSRIDAFAHNLHFDRFLPQDGSKRPDIDIDFEAKRRDDIRNYLTRKYGIEHVATVAAVGAYCTRGIVREVGKALGLPNELIGFLAKKIHGGVSPHHLEEALEKRPELRGSSIPRERFQWVFRLAERLMDIPRNIRVHSSGVVISRRPLADTVPVMWSASPGDLEGQGTRDKGQGGEGEWRSGGTGSMGGVGSMGEGDQSSILNHQSSNQSPVTLHPSLRMIQWDKRSAKHYFDKFDILCLRGQDVLSGTQERIRINNLDFRVDNLPMDDPHTYSAMRSGELIGIPQSASPAMRQAHIRLRTENLHDASLVQAGIRPGVGGAVKLNELIARRRGNVAYSFSHPELERILGLTYGITVFQEQVDQLLQSFCGFTSGEAEDMREAIHERRREDYGRQMRERLIDHMVKRGHSLTLAEEVFELIAGFKGYGFAQGHALAFAEVSIRSIYCQQNFPAEYFSALLSAQPAGYYGPCTLVNEARNRGVAILPPDVNRSRLEFSVESVKSDMDPKMVFPGGGIRVGLNQIAGVSVQTKGRMVGVKLQATRIGAEAVESAYISHPQPPPSPIRFAHFPSAGSSTVTNQTEGWGSEAQQTNCEEAAGINSVLKNSLQSPRLPSLAVLDQAEEQAQAHPRFSSFFDFVAKAQPSRDELEHIILCGALDSLCPNRRAMLWSIPAAQKYAAACAEPGSLPLIMPEPEMASGIEDFSTDEKAIYERMFLDLDVREHLMAFERERVAARGAITTAEARRLSNAKKAIVVGNPIRLRFPPTPSGKRVVFFDLEDETGLLNVTCFDAVYQRDGHAIVCSPYVTLIGEGQDRDGHVAFLAHRVFPYHPVMGKNRRIETPLPVTTADFLVG